MNIKMILRSWIFVCIMIFGWISKINGDLLHYKQKRHKRSDLIDFLGELDRVAQTVGAAIFGPNTALSNLWKGTPQLPQSGQQQFADASGGIRRTFYNQQQPTSAFPPLKSFWFCTNHPKNCEHLHCLAENFQHGDQAANLKAGSIALTDIKLRKALIEDPKILKIACDKANLHDFQCSQFKMLLGLADAIDPAHTHFEDEPRDKRAAAVPDYYDYLDSVKAQKVGQNVGGAPGGTEPFRGQQVTPSGGYRQRDCNAILRSTG